jgi:hypothetical protein
MGGRTLTLNRHGFARNNNACAKFANWVEYLTGKL